MKNRFVIFLFYLFIPVHSFAVDFPGGESDSGAMKLSAESFPKTINDLSFVDRIAVLTDGYQPWESEYDEQTGVCISNCAYDGITIETDLQSMERATAEARAKLSEAEIKKAEDEKNKKTFLSDVKVYATSEYKCDLKNNSISPDQNIPLGIPLVGSPKIKSGFGKRILYGKLEPHRGVDYSVPSGTTVYSPANGIVKNVWTDNKCGNGLRVKHSDGFATVYCHLSSVDVKTGDNVGAGCAIAKSGNTGRSTGPHLHYAINYGSNYINPTEFINYGKTVYAFLFDLIFIL